MGSHTSSSVAPRARGERLCFCQSESGASLSVHPRRPCEIRPSTDEAPYCVIATVGRNQSLTRRPLLKSLFRATFMMFRGWPLLLSLAALNAGKTLGQVTAGTPGRA